MKVSVWMISYNQNKFISQAIDSILNQKTDFEYEIIIGDDFSSDGTVDIIKNYEQKYPQIIKPIYRTSNIGMISNMIETFSKCSGEFIALCEGDDYWTDPLKLQKQISFLEHNSDFSICFHNVFIQNNGKKRKVEYYEKDVYTLNDLSKYNFIHTVSCVFTNNFKRFEFPSWVYDMSVGDYILHIFNAQYGKIKYIDEVMAVYRIHSTNTWVSDKNMQYKWIQNQEILANNLIINDNNEFIEGLKKSISRNYYKLFIDNYNINQVQAECYFEKACQYSPQTIANFVFRQNNLLLQIKKATGYNFLLFLKKWIKKLIFI